MDADRRRTAAAQARVDSGQDGCVIIDGGTARRARQKNRHCIYVDTNDHSLEIELENNVITNLGFIGGGARSS
ncbi:MAG: hypothetical protein R2854_04770 [Caldilineaceae bacterium]